MKAEGFRKLTSELEQLTPHQKQVLVDRLRTTGQSTGGTRLGAKPGERASCLCPHCGGKKVSRWGMASGLQRYRCGGCKATFNALTGTPLARLRHKDKWLQYSQQMAAGQSVRKSAVACDVHRNTAFRWRHRAPELPCAQRATQLVGIAEADETFFLASVKGKKRGMERATCKARRQGRQARVVR